MHTLTRCGVRLVTTYRSPLQELLMRTRLLGFTAAVILAALGAMGPVAQAAVPSVDGQTCMAGGGSVEYDSGAGLWSCIGGDHDGEPIQ